ncbi:MAG: hypothetical protein NC548_40800 [Lachnospiraceae bacterium]|nr:hypothetical protein [Lachnospiraceae bacterium]
MKNCSFCKLLNRAIDNDEYYKKPHEYTVSLIARNYYDGYVCGQLTYESYPLNYCPVCGEKLDLEEIRSETKEKYREKN